MRNERWRTGQNWRGKIKYSSTSPTPKERKKKKERSRGKGTQNCIYSHWMWRKGLGSKKKKKAKYYIPPPYHSGWRTRRRKSNYHSLDGDRCYWGRRWGSLRWSQCPPQFTHTSVPSSPTQQQEKDHRSWNSTYSPRRGPLKKGRKRNRAPAGWGTCFLASTLRF